MLNKIRAKANKMVRDSKKNAALDVIYETKENLANKSEKISLEKAFEIIDRKFKHGGNSELSTEERVSLLKASQIHIQEAINMIAEALKGTSEEQFSKSTTLSELFSLMESRSDERSGVADYISTLESERFWAYEDSYSEYDNNDLDRDDFWKNDDHYEIGGL